MSLPFHKTIDRQRETWDTEQDKWFHPDPSCIAAVGIAFSGDLYQTHFGEGAQISS